MDKVKILAKLSIGLTLWLAVGLPLALAAPPSTGARQTAGPSVYIVQPGDTLTLIALRYNLTLADLAQANQLTNPNLIFPGQQLILPGAPAVITPTLQAAPPVAATPPTPGGTLAHIIQPGDTLFGIAARYGVSIGAIVQANALTNPDVIAVGQTLQIPTGPLPTPEPAAPPFAAITLSEPVIIQGRALVVKVTLTETATLSGMFEDRPLFFSQNNGQWWSLVAIHALTPPNDYPLILTAARPDGAVITATKNVTVIAGPYATENIQLDDSRSSLLDAKLLKAEREKLVGFWTQVTPESRWQGSFRYPLETPRITSFFGARRSYNGGPATSFHEGLDFGGGVGVPIYAAADGVVVLAEELTVRGKAVLIDHGLGVFSGYWHNSQLAVTPGQAVKAGDVIGYMGATGLATGPHLHWEIRLQNINVDPSQWVEETIP